MKHKRTAIYFMTILLLAAAVYFGVPAKDQKPALAFKVVAESGAEEIRAWEQEKGEYYVFLPGYADLSQLQIRFWGEVQLDGAEMKNGMTCENLELDRRYTLTGLDGPASLTFLRSANLPAMYVNTASGNMDYIHENKEHEEAGSLRLYTEQGQLNYAGSIESIKGHGNSTFVPEKKPYSLKLAAQGDLLGMGAAKKWVLLSNCYDFSHMKNKLVYDYADQMGLAFSPQSRWVDLYLNGSYAGVYLLCEKNEIHPQRVDLKNGRGFLVSKDHQYRMDELGIHYILTEAGVPLRVHECTISENDMAALWQLAEDAVLASDGLDPRTGKHWTERIDLDSWAKKYLVEEIFGGGDAGRYSQYFYYEGDGTQGKIYAGPVWDYDITMGLDSPENLPNLFYAHRSGTSPWFRALYDNEVFYSRITELFRDTFCPGLEKLVEEQIPAYKEFLGPAAKMNQLRWGGDFEGEVKRMQTYMAGRIDFLKDVWLEEREYMEVTVLEVGVLPQFAPMYAVARGERLPNLPQWQECDWYIAGTDTPFDLSQPIDESVSIQARLPETEKE